MRHKKSADEILNDEETLDIEKAAEVILAQKAKDEKKKRPRNIKNGLVAWEKKKARNKEEEELRLKIAEAWNRKK